jgi:hypothetical protein
MPTIVLDRPVLIFVAVFVVLFVTTRAGALIAELLWPVKDDERPNLNLVVNGSLALLTLVTSLTYYFAMTKHDQRRDCEIGEADAIATAYFRAGLLPAEEATSLRQLIFRYLDQRISFYSLREAHQLEANEIETQKLRTEMWVAVENPANSDARSNTVGLVVDGMNAMLNSQRDTTAAWKRRIPAAGWSLMNLIAMYTCLLTGYAAHKRGVLLYTLLPFLVALAFYLMGDMDNPRNGIILVTRTIWSISLVFCMASSSDGLKEGACIRRRIFVSGGNGTLGLH